MCRGTPKYRYCVHKCMLLYPIVKVGNVLGRRKVKSCSFLKKLREHMKQLRDGTSGENVVSHLVNLRGYRCRLHNRLL